MKKSLVPLLAAGLLIGQVSASRAVLIGELNNVGGDVTQYYQYTNNGLAGPAGLGTFATTSVSIAQSYTFTLNPGVIPTTIPVHLTGFSSINAGPNAAPPGFINQMQQGVTWTITNDLPVPLSGGGSIAAGSTVLRIVGVPNPSPFLPPTGHISQTGSAPPSFSGSAANVPFNTPDSFTFASDFYTGAFSIVVPESYTWSFTEPPAVAWPVNAANGIVDNALWGGNANFSATVSSPVPEPGSLALLLGSGVSGSLFLIRRRRRA